MAESGIDPVSGVRVMGCVRGRGRGVTEGYREWVQGYGACPEEMMGLRVCCGIVLRSGLVRQCDGFASDRHNRED